MPQKEKLAAEEKVKIVKKCIRGGISFSEASHRAGVSFETVRTWVRQYEAEGSSAFNQSRIRRYTTEIKEQAVLDYLSCKGSL